MAETAIILALTAGSMLWIVRSGWGRAPDMPEVR